MVIFFTWSSIISEEESALFFCLFEILPGGSHDCTFSCHLINADGIDSIVTVASMHAFVMFATLFGHCR